MSLSTEILLPELQDSTKEQQEAFAIYNLALEKHELGHHAIALAAAHNIENSIRKAGAHQDCEMLGTYIKTIANSFVQHAKAADRQFDMETGYGRKQGVSLDR